MRTTVRLNEELMNEVKQEAARRGESLTALIEQALQLLLSRRPSKQPPGKVKIPVSKSTGGTLPGVNLDDTGDLYEIMDGRK